MKKLLSLLFILGVAFGAAFIASDVGIDTSPHYSYVSNFDEAEISIAPIITTKIFTESAEVTQDVNVEEDIALLGDDLRDYDLLCPEVFSFSGANLISRKRNCEKQESYRRWQHDPDPVMIS